jgi:hypothetical protein
MTNILEKLGLKKSSEEIQQQKEIQGMERYLKETIAQYEMNQYRLQNMPETFLGSGHKVDTQDISALENSLENLRKIILDMAQRLGRDGNPLISEVDEKVRKSQELKKAA